MSLRDINHQAAIELGECDTEFVATLKKEQQELRDELAELARDQRRTDGKIKRIAVVRQRLARIEELLA